jgi:hypothetical protein
LKISLAYAICMNVSSGIKLRYRQTAVPVNNKRTNARYLSVLNSGLKNETIFFKKKPPVYGMYLKRAVHLA